MDNEAKINLSVEIPFPTERLAEIVYHSLRVDAEPKRSGVTKELSYNNNILIGKFISPTARQLRVAINGFFESINLVTETFNFTGSSISETYDHFI